MIMSTIVSRAYRMLISFLPHLRLVGKENCFPFSNDNIMS